MGSAHAQLVHMVSADGRASSWALAQLAGTPNASSELRASVGPQLLPVAPSCAAFAGAHESDSFFVGCESGSVYLTSRSASDSDLNQQPHLEAHRGPVRRLAVASPPPGSSSGAVLASVGADWAVRVWDAGKARSLSLPSLGCAGASISWGRPGILFAGDARGRLHTWDLSRGARVSSVTEISSSPLSALTVHHGLLLAGDAAGVVHVYRPHESLLVGDEHQKGFEAVLDAVAN